MDEIEKPVSLIRESTRNIVKLSRRNHRDEESDSRRSIANSNKSSKDTVNSLATKLKTKSSVSFEELKTLKNAILEDSSHVETLLSTHGALRGLVREVTSLNVKKQIESSACLCNLGLGDSRASSVIAKAAGLYVITNLDSLSSDLCVTSAWTLGNLAGSGSKVCDILIAQGALSKLVEVLSKSTDEETADAALYAIQHFVYQLNSDLSSEHINTILAAASKTEVSATSSHIIFTLSCHPHFPEIMSDAILHKLLNDLTVSIKKFIENKTHSDEIIFLTRTLANVCDDADVCDQTLVLLIDNNIGTGFKHVLNANNGTINNSVMWFLGNLLKYSSKGSIMDQFFGELCT